jgi:acetoin utilization protein AcuB
MRTTSIRAWPEKREEIVFVCDRMSAPAMTIRPNTSIQDAHKLMRERKFRRLPVVNKRGKLVGIVSERDLLHAAPSSATSLSIWEVHYLLTKAQVKGIMTRDVITAAPDMPIETAARLMVTHKIGGLPVTDEHNEVIGVITETDLFETFVEMFAGDRAGLRLTLEVPEKRGVLSMLSSAVFDLGGSIESVGSFYGEDAGTRRLVVKVRDVSKAQLVSALEALGDHVVDARDV